jgi:large subunit ribosomal protein L35
MPTPIARNKTRKSVAKRFKITATGKVLRTRGGRRHLLQCKSSKRKRKLAKSVLVHDSDAARVKANLPFA